MGCMTDEFAVVRGSVVVSVKIISLDHVMDALVS